MLVERCAAHQDPIPWGTRWLAAIITFKVHAVSSGALDRSGCLLEIVHLICTALAHTAWRGGGWKEEVLGASLSIFCYLACSFALHMHLIYVDDGSTRCTNLLSPVYMFTWWYTIAAATRVFSYNSLCRMHSAKVDIFNVYYIIINRPRAKSWN